MNEQAFDLLDAEPIRITGKDVPTPYAKNLEEIAFPSVRMIIDASRKIATDLKKLVA